MFVIIMVAVGLFAGLMFTFSRGAQEGGSNISDKQAELAANRLVSYGQQVERAVNRIYRKGCSIDQISFEHADNPGHVNPEAPADNSCHVFHPDGGGARFQNCIAQSECGAGEGITTVTEVTFRGFDTSARDLVLRHYEIPWPVCQAVNKMLNLPHELNTVAIEQEWGGGYTGPGSGVGGQTPDNGGDWGAFAGKATGCIERGPDGTGGQGYWFYKVLLTQ